MRILVVEDEETNRFVLERLLEPYGDVDGAVNGMTALEMFRSADQSGQGYDLILLDIMMPKMDGHEVLREIRAMEEMEGISPDKGVKVVITTALSDQSNRESAFREQCDGYLVKPIKSGDVYKTLKKLGLL